MKKIGTSVALSPDIKEWAETRAKNMNLSVGEYINALVFLDREVRFEIEAAHEGQKVASQYGREIGQQIYVRFVDKKREEEEKAKAKEKPNPLKYVEKPAKPAFTETPPAVIDAPTESDGQGRNEMI